MVKKAFKMACLAYQSGLVTFEKQQYERNDLIEKMNQELKNQFERYKAINAVEHASEYHSTIASPQQVKKDSTLGLVS